MNRLLHEERAIVSSIHGTTRDTIEDTIDIQGITFRFIDTAGIRQTDNEIEQIGINRTYQAISKARIILLLIDEEPSQKDIEEILEKINDKSLIIIENKIDINITSIQLPALDGLQSYPLIRISARTGKGIDALENAIFAAANIPTLTDTDVIVTSARHYDALISAHQSILRVLDGMGQLISGDLLAEDLRIAIDQLAEITGSQITPNEILGNIFKNFCVGK